LNKFCFIRPKSRRRNQRHHAFELSAGQNRILLGDGSDYGVNLLYQMSQNLMGTGGAYKSAAEAIS